MKGQMNVRVSDATRAKLDWLAERYGTQAEAISVAVDRLYVSERGAVSYQYWHHKSGEVYAVRIEGGRLTGVCGPLHYSEVRAANLPDMHYDDAPEDVEWALERDSEFVLVEPTE